MPKLIHPLLMLIAQATEKDLVLYVDYLFSARQAAEHALSPDRGWRRPLLHHTATPEAIGTWLGRNSRTSRRPVNDVQTADRCGESISSRAM